MYFIYELVNSCLNAFGHSCDPHSLSLDQGMRFSSLWSLSVYWFPFLQTRTEHEAALVL